MLLPLSLSRLVGGKDDWRCDRAKKIHKERLQMLSLMCILFSVHRLDKELTRSSADTLDRYEVPFFGPLASRFVDDE